MVFKGGESIYMANTEHQKAEPTFEINAFDRPLDLSGYDAWARQIIRLMFQEKGTYPSDPDMGCGISAENYQSINELKARVRSSVEAQVHRYFPDIPLAAINCYSEDELIDGGDPTIVYYMISFQVNAHKIVTVKVPSRAANKVIDFEIRF